VTPTVTVTSSPELDEAIASSFEEQIAAQRAARATNVIHGAFAS